MNRILKIGMSSVLYLSAVLVVSGCQFMNESPQFSLSRKPFVALATSTERKTYQFDDERKEFIGTDGKSLRKYLLKINGIETSYIRFVAYTKRAVTEIKHLSETLQIPRNKPTKSEFSLNSFGRYPPVELTVEVLRFALEVKSCHAENNRVSFGCAVDINRALSLADPHELVSGRTLSPSTGQRDIDVMQQYSKGKSTPFSDREN